MVLRNICCGLVLGTLVFSSHAVASTVFPHVAHLLDVACSDCHTRDDELKLKPVLQEACDACHHDKPVTLTKTTPKKFLKWDFPHDAPAHQERCTECHLRTEDMPPGYPGEPRFRTETCFGCHDQRGADTPAARCAPCHDLDQGTKAPDWHGDDWKETHGEVAHTPAFSDHSRTCFGCHDLGVDDPRAPSECKECHQKEKPLSHRAHIEDRDALCEKCHSSAVDANPPGVRTESCEECHTGAVLSSEIRGGRARPMLVEFPHAPHTSNNVVECAECHAATMEDRQPEGAPVMAQQNCVSCHTERDVPVGERRCAQCHGADRKLVKPKSHAGTWLLRHRLGEDSLGMAEHGSDCADCHGRAPCKSCHRTSRPRSHTAWWREKTHGMAAEWDRETCTTCHETGTCVSCHRSAVPASHRGGWDKFHGLVAKSKTNASCSACHQLAWCSACHRGE